VEDLAERLRRPLVTAAADDEAGQAEAQTEAKTTTA
jgi:hypothetical protein